MTIESIPKFSGPAAKLWATVPAHAKKLPHHFLLRAVQCYICIKEIHDGNQEGIT